jgi:vesicle-fusing ATPase
LTDTVTVSPLPAPPHPHAPLFLESLTVEVGFAKRGHEVAEQFSADDMATTFVKAYRGTSCSIGQQLVMEYHGQNLIAKVVSVDVVELADNQRGGAGGGNRVDMGIVMDRTDVTIGKAADSKIKLKSSAKK